MTMTPSDRHTAGAVVLAEIRRIALPPFADDHEIKPTDDLFADLDLDSLQLITLAVTIESHFGIALPEDAASRVRTVSDVCQLITQALDAQK